MQDLVNELDEVTMVNNQDVVHDQDLPDLQGAVSTLNDQTEDTTKTHTLSVNPGRLYIALLATFQRK